MRVVAVTEPGVRGRPNEDHVEIGSDIAIVIDGATSRTDTGCIHGVSWYASQLGAALQNRQYAEKSLTALLAGAIEDVRAFHEGTCDLNHPGTPSAVIAILRRTSTAVQWLVLGDVTLILDTDEGMHVITEGHDHIAAEERAEADRYPIGDERKAEALLRMKHIELANRNVAGGFWVASTDPAVAEHALTGAVDHRSLRRAVLMTDGAARLMDVFSAANSAELVRLASELGPQEILRQVREFEDADPEGARWPRNKRSDDASAILCELREPAA